MPKEFKDKVTCSLCLLRTADQLLLAPKKRHLVAGRWNGYGGEEKPGESARQTAIRELAEETGGVNVAPDDLSRRAILYFHNHDANGQKKFIVKVHVYVARKWEGLPEETAEMGQPVWFPIGDLPWHKMPMGDIFWLPRVLRGEKVIGHVHYGPGQKILLFEPDIRLAPELLEDEPED
jgi:8-oxo-dGTP diphosphatase